MGGDSPLPEGQTLSRGQTLSGDRPRANAFGLNHGIRTFLAAVMFYLYFHIFVSSLNCRVIKKLMPRAARCPWMSKAPCDGDSGPGPGGLCSVRRTASRGFAGMTGGPACRKQQDVMPDLIRHPPRSDLSCLDLTWDVK